MNMSQGQSQSRSHHAARARRAFRCRFSLSIRIALASSPCPISRKTFAHCSQGWGQKSLPQPGRVLQPEPLNPRRRRDVLAGERPIAAAVEHSLPSWGQLPFLVGDRVQGAPSGPAPHQSPPRPGGRTPPKPSPHRHSERPISPAPKSSSLAPPPQSRSSRFRQSVRRGPHFPVALKPPLRNTLPSA